MAQAGGVADAVSAYGAATKAKFNDPSAKGQPEDQLRNPLETLFKAVAAALGKPAPNLVGETSLADLKTRPDFSVTMNGALAGFIEVKAPGKGADPRKFKDPHDKAQWDKLKALPNLLYTDGGNFSLWRDGQLVGTIVALGDVETAGAKLAAAPDFAPLIDNFLTWHPVAPKTAPELAAVAARLCRFLRDEVLEQLEQGSTPLKTLAEDWRKLLFPNNSDAEFADGYAQAVTFGLLMAKSRKLSLAAGLDPVAKELGKTNSLIGTALRLLTEQPEAVLVTSLETLARVLDVIDWDKISKGAPEAWIDFYEDFLAVYDNRLRKLTGSYYTPPQVVQAMVRLCDEALRAPGRFAVAAGLADPQVQIADPATGSGTFLLALLRHIANAIKADQGEGAVPAAMTEAAKRLFGFELQFGAFAVAQLRLLAEMIDLGADGAPRLFVTDTLGDPYAAFERAPGIYGLLSQSQADANEVKRTQPITVVIGNPPYKEKAKGRGGWVESGSGNKAAPLADWFPPAKWGVGAHSKHLRNLYVYFWRWAAWKVFEQGRGLRDKTPPIPEKHSGLICYITVAGFLNGPGFQKMRADLRRDCDDIWVIDCSPEGHQPEVSSRIFQGVQHPVCIVLAARSPANDPAKPAHVRFRSLAEGRREGKFAELATVAIDGPGWADAPDDWRAPFLPEFAGGWGDFWPLDAVVGDSGSGVMPGRTWIIAPDAGSLTQRWAKLVEEPDKEKRRAIFHPHLRNGEAGDRHISKGANALGGIHGPLRDIETLLGDLSVAKTAAAAREELTVRAPVRYGFRSFDRQWIIPDARVINQPNPELWRRHGIAQIYLTAPMDLSPSSGPALSATATAPDLHHYAGRGGRTFALWRDAAATEPNISEAALGALEIAYGAEPDPVDVFAYVAALLACPAYTETFRADLIRPGLRVPLTADAALFAEAAALGREVIWLHSFGDRFADPAAGRPAGPPRVAGGPTIPKAGAIPSTSEGFPDSLTYDAADRRLHVGAGFIDNVAPEVWAYEVSGKRVLTQWFSYRKKNRERPQIGDKRPPSPLGDIQPDHWLPEYTSELLNVLHVLTRLVALEPRQAALLAKIVDGPLIAWSEMPTQGG